MRVSFEMVLWIGNGSLRSGAANGLYAHVKLTLTQHRLNQVPK